jgi:hypothetical protein
MIKDDKLRRKALDEQWYPEVSKEYNNINEKDITFKGQEPHISQYGITSKIDVRIRKVLDLILRSDIATKTIGRLFSFGQMVLVKDPTEYIESWEPALIVGPGSFSHEFWIIQFVTTRRYLLISRMCISAQIDPLQYINMLDELDFSFNNVRNMEYDDLDRDEQMAFNDRVDDDEDEDYSIDTYVTGYEQ